MLTSPGNRFLANFRDLFNSAGHRIVPAFREFEAELNVRDEFFVFIFLFLLEQLTAVSLFLLSSSSPPPTTKPTPQADLSTLAEMAGELRAARAKSEAKLRLGRRRLKELKSVIEEIDNGDDGDDGDEGEEGGNNEDPFNDADTVAGRSPGVFSDPGHEEF